MKFQLPFKKTIGSAVVMALMAAAIAVPGQVFAKDKIVWRVQSHWPRASTSFEDGIMVLKQKFKKCTDGQLVLDIYPAGALFSAQESFAAVKRGVIPMATTSPSYMRDITNLASIAAGLPFAFQHVWEAMYFYKNMGFEKALKEELAQYGIYYATSKLYPTEMVVKQPINSLEDFKSLSLRSSGILQKFLTKAGASASYISGSELYTALATGVVDGAHWGAAQGAKDMGLYEVAKYHVKPSLGIGADSMIINMEALHNLPPEIERCVKDTLDDFFWERTNQYIYLEKVALSYAVNNLGVEVIHLPPEVINHLTATAQGMWQNIGSKGPKAQKWINNLMDFLDSLGRLPKDSNSSDA